MMSEQVQEELLLSEPPVWYGLMNSPDHVKAPVHTAIAAWEWGAYLGDEPPLLQNLNK